MKRDIQEQEESWYDFHKRHHSEQFHFSCKNDKLLLHGRDGRACDRYNSRVSAKQQQQQQHHRRQDDGEWLASWRAASLSNKAHSSDKMAKRFHFHSPSAVHSPPTMGSATTSPPTGLKRRFLNLIRRDGHHHPETPLRGNIKWATINSNT